MVSLLDVIPDEMTMLAECLGTENNEHTVRELKRAASDFAMYAKARATIVPAAVKRRHVLVLRYLDTSVFTPAFLSHMKTSIAFSEFHRVRVACGVAKQIVEWACMIQYTTGKRMSDTEFMFRCGKEFNAQPIHIHSLVLQVLERIHMLLAKRDDGDVGFAKPPRGSPLADVKVWSMMKLAMQSSNPAQRIGEITAMLTSFVCDTWRVQIEGQWS
jgi:hypothetical protein